MHRNQLILRGVNEDFAVCAAAVQSLPSFWCVWRWHLWRLNLLVFVLHVVETSGGSVCSCLWIRASSCIDFNEQVRDWLKKTPSIKYVVLSSPFLTFFDEASGFYSEERGFSDPTSEALFQELKATLDYFAGIGIRPVVFAPPPTTNARLNPGFCLSKALLLSKRFEACEFSTTDLKEESAHVRDVLKRIDGLYRVFWFDPYICEDDICRPSMQQTILYQDHGHLTHEGSAELGRIANFYGFITG